MIRVTVVSEVDHDSTFYIFFTFLTAAIAERKRYLVQAQGKATLQCENEKLGQKQCKGTTWIFISGINRTTVELFQYGEINGGSKEQSHRLSLDESCSLVIRKVTVEDAGSYVCQQWSGTKGTKATKQATDSTVDLSVVTGESLTVGMCSVQTVLWIKSVSPSPTVTAQRESDVVIFNCSVSPVHDCPYTVKWQLRGSDIVGKFDDIQTATSSCSAAVKVWRPCDNIESRIQHLRCGVKSNTGKEKFFNPPSICETSGVYVLSRYCHYKNT